MPAVLYDANGVKIGEAILGIAPAGTANIADTIALFAPGSWPSPWVFAGATEEGYQLETSASTTDHRIEEQALPVDQTLESRGFVITADLAEDSIQSMVWSNGLAPPVIAAPTSVLPGTTKSAMSDTIYKYAVILEMANKAGLARRWYCPIATALGTAATRFRRSASKRLHPVTFTAVCPTTSIQVVDVTAPPTG